MRILIFVLLLLGASLQAQNVLTCYDYSDFLQSDCVGCGLKDSTFSGILLVKNGTIYQPLVKPIKIKTRPNILDMEDGFATRVSIYIDQITTYNTEASVLAFLRACACGVIVDSTMITEGWGINVTEPTANNYVVGADSLEVATTYDLTLKQDLLNGVAPRIPFFTSATTLGTNANFYWDNTYSEMAIKDRLFGSNATGQLYIGYLAGDAATSATHSNFLSDRAGQLATNATQSNFFGFRSGYQATNASNSNFLGYEAGQQATNAAHSTFMGYKAGRGATDAKYSFFVGDSTGMGATGAEYANFLGYRSGYNASNAYWSNFFGRDAGSGATQAYYSNFIGYKAGSGALLSYGSNFIGYLAGYGSETSEYSNFVGHNAGWSCLLCPNSNYIGKNAGYGAVGASESNFMGFNAGNGATYAYGSNFFGYNAGNSSSAEYSNFFGSWAGMDQNDASYSTFIGYRAGEGTVGRYLGANNIIIGTNINLPENSSNAMSLGNVLYGTGFKYDPTDADSTQYISTQGKIGVLTATPTQQLHVAGNLRVEGAIYDSNNEPGTSGQVLSTTITGTDWVDMAGGDTTQYLNPYIMGPDTVGFYLTIAQDTVLFVATADTTAGTVDIVTGTSPIIITGDATHTPNVTIQNATTSQSGALTSTDWNTFNSKIGGSGTATHIPYFTGTTTLGSSANHTWDNANNTVQINGNIIQKFPNSSYTNTNIGTNMPLTLTGSYNFATGFENLKSATTAGSNFSSGYRNLYSLTTGNYNFASGTRNLYTTTTQSYNFGSGYENLYSNSGSSNFANGNQNMYSNTGSYNFAAGEGNLNTNTGSYNFASGGYNLYNTTGSYNFATGVTNMFAASSGSYNFANGGNNLRLCTSCSYNFGNGFENLKNITTGQANFASGLQNLTAITTGSYNIALPYQAGYQTTTGENNIFLGYYSGYSNVTGSKNVFLGFNSGFSETGSSKLYITNTAGTTTGIFGDFVATRFGINQSPASLARTFDVNGEVRIRDLTTDTPTGLVGHDADGDIGSVALSGLSMVSGTLTNSFNGDITGVTVTAPLTGGGTSGSISVGLDTTSATGVATQYDLTQVAGSSKVIDILGSDYTTSATSLQSTALTYTFPSTGTYEIKVYGSYTCSNTANGINVGFIDSGGLVASYITGKHMAFTNNTSSSSTETRKPISAIGTTLSTASVGASSTQYTVMSEALITVSTAGTITLGFASGSGSYSATLQAGSSLLIEKLN